jgi:hypothetical protein
VLLREQARRTNTKMVDLAASLLASHRLLSGERAPAPSGEELLTPRDDVDLAKASCLSLRTGSVP